MKIRTCVAHCMVMFMISLLVNVTGGPIAKAADITLVSFSPETVVDPSATLEGRDVKTRDDAEFTKLGFVFAKPISFAKIKVEACQGEFKDGIDFYMYPGWRSSFSEGGKPKIISPAIAGQPIESVALVFRHNRNVCVKSIGIEDEKGVAVPLVSTLVKSVEEIAKGSDGSEKMRRAFAGPGLIDVIDRELSTKNERENWLFRFRSDGTYFVRGFDDDYDKARAFSSIGTYDVKSSVQHKITLQLNGWRVSTPQAWDGIICPMMCGKSMKTGSTETNAKVDAKTSATPVSDEVVVESLKGEVFMMRNRTSASKRSLPFADLRVKLSTLDE
jgi:hypothetical protein